MGAELKFRQTDLSLEWIDSQTGFGNFWKTSKISPGQYMSTKTDFKVVLL